MAKRQPDGQRSNLDRAADELEPRIHSIEHRDGREVHVFDFTDPGVADRLRDALRADLGPSDDAEPADRNEQKE